MQLTSRPHGGLSDFRNRGKSESGERRKAWASRRRPAEKSGERRLTTALHRGAAVRRERFPFNVTSDTERAAGKPREGAD
ncbi:hypothetical protein AAFF_G00071570 [Aldrovandia affinis]|uniref:Uncharacterized protein n=1 Tax=Aldrovandia affinis TaxID=143900 RepID=A0AAD7WDQ2_9TELE|nr:hypothetical protein AAFF_G00071570 [Aldrovandia affinis]